MKAIGVFIAPAASWSLGSILPGTPTPEPPGGRKGREFRRLAKTWWGGEEWQQGNGWEDVVVMAGRALSIKIPDDTSQFSPGEKTVSRAAAGLHPWIDKRVVVNVGGPGGQRTQPRLY